MKPKYSTGGDGMFVDRNWKYEVKVVVNSSDFSFVRPNGGVEGYFH